MANSDSLSIFVALGQSLLTLGIGYLCSVILGLLLGILIGIHPILCQIGSRLLQLPVAVPVVYITFFLVLTESNRYTTLLSVIFSSVWFIAIYTGLGLQRALRHNKYALAIPRFFQGLRFGLMIAWGTLITAEVILSGLQGLGFYLWDAYQNNNTNNTFLGITIITLAVFITDQLLDLCGYLIKRTIKH
jgi:bicarbonate transport system permease protein